MREGEGKRGCGRGRVGIWKGKGGGERGAGGRMVEEFVSGRCRQRAGERQKAGVGGVRYCTSMCTKLCALLRNRG